MPSDSARTTVHVAGTIRPELRSQLEDLADLVPYGSAADAAPLLADGREDPPLLADRDVLHSILASGRLLAVAHPSPEHLRLLRSLTGVGVNEPVDMISYGRIPDMKLRWCVPYHFHCVPKRKHVEEALRKAPDFGGQDVVDALALQKNYLESGEAAPAGGMIPPNPDAVFTYYTTSGGPWTQSWVVPVGRASSQGLSLSYTLKVYGYYVNGVSGTSPYYLAIVMLYPTITTGATAQWIGTKTFPVTGDTPYFLENASLTMAWNANGTASFGSVTAFPWTMLTKAPSGILNPAAPSGPGQPQNVTVQLGGPEGGGIPVSMYSDGDSGWTVPKWSTGNAQAVMNITQDMGMQDPGTSSSGWSFPTEWLYTPNGKNAGDVRPLSFQTPASQLVMAPITQIGQSVALPILSNPRDFFPPVPTSSSYSNLPYIPPVPFTGLTSQNTATFYAVTMVGPNLGPNTGSGYVMSQQFFPPPFASLSIEVLLTELLTSVGLYDIILGTYWTSSALAAFPWISVSLNPIPSFTINANGENFISASVQASGSTTAQITVQGVGAFDEAVTFNAPTWTTVPSGATPPTVTYSATSVTPPVMQTTSVTVTIAASSSTGQFIGSITATSPGYATQSLSLTVYVTSS